MFSLRFAIQSVQEKQQYKNFVWNHNIYKNLCTFFSDIEPDLNFSCFGSVTISKICFQKLNVRITSQVFNRIGFWTVWL